MNIEQSRTAMCSPCSLCKADFDHHMRTGDVTYAQEAAQLDKKKASLLKISIQVYSEVFAFTFIFMPLFSRGWPSSHRTYWKIGELD